MVPYVSNAETHWYDCFYCSPKKRHERQKAKWEEDHRTHVRVKSLMEEEKKRQAQHIALIEKHKKMQEDDHHHVSIYSTPLIF